MPLESPELLAHLRRNFEPTDSSLRHGNVLLALTIYQHAVSRGIIEVVPRNDLSVWSPTERKRCLPPPSYELYYTAHDGVVGWSPDEKWSIYDDLVLAATYGLVFASSTVELLRGRELVAAGPYPVVEEGILSVVVPGWQPS